MEGRRIDIYCFRLYCTRQKTQPSTLVLPILMVTKRSRRYIILIACASLFIFAHLVKRSFFLLTFTGMDPLKAENLAPFIAAIINLMIATAIFFVITRPCVLKRTSFGKCKEWDQELLRTYVSDVGTLFRCKNCGKVYRYVHGEGVAESLKTR